MTTLSAFLTSWLFEIHFEFLAGPRPISESVIIDGAVIKISEEIIIFSDLGQNPAAKVGVFNGRVVKS